MSLRVPTSLREVESSGVAAKCESDGGTFPFGALWVDSFGMVWHDGSEFKGDIICYGPFSLHAISRVPKASEGESAE